MEPVLPPNFVDKGIEIYQTRIVPKLDIEELKGKIVAVDVESGDYFVEQTVLKAVMLGRKKYPRRQFYCERVGYNAVYSYKGVVHVPAAEDSK